MATTRRGASQSQKMGRNNQNQELVPKQVKRVGDENTNQAPAKRKRTAFVDLTNARNNQSNAPVAKKQTIKTNVGGKKKSKTIVVVPKSKPATTSTSGSQPESKAEVSYDVIELSQESQASQDTNSSSQSSTLALSQNSSTSSDNDSMVTLIDPELQATLRASSSDSDSTVDLTADPVKDYEDIDAENIADPFQVAMYANDIFNHYKEREAQFVLPDFMNIQPDLTPHMRTILVDWLVEVQENFELNHETLYLAIKLVDHFLSNKHVKRDRLQLVGATALFISCKFDERCPPVLDDFLYICDDAYKKEEIIRMEMNILRAIDFDLGIPLSYRFLRRFSKCARAQMETLTLARYILERSLMDYRYTQQADSKMAASALLLALSLKNAGTWNQTLVHYTGYQKEELLPLVFRLNKMISAKPNKNLTTIFSKYSHKVFHEVALTKPLMEEDLTQLGVTADMTSEANTSTSSQSSSNDSS